MMYECARDVEIMELEFVNQNKNVGEVVLISGFTRFIQESHFINRKPEHFKYKRTEIKFRITQLTF